MDVRKNTGLIAGTAFGGTLVAGAAIGLAADTKMSRGAIGTGAAGAMAFLAIGGHKVDDAGFSPAPLNLAWAGAVGTVSAVGGSYLKIGPSARAGALFLGGAGALAMTLIVAGSSAA